MRTRTKQSHPSLLVDVQYLHEEGVGSSRFNLSSVETLCGPIVTAAHPHSWASLVLTRLSIPHTTVSSVQIHSQPKVGT